MVKIRPKDCELGASPVCCCPVGRAEPTELYAVMEMTQITDLLSNSQTLQMAAAPVIHQQPVDPSCLTAVPFHLHSSQQQIRSPGFRTTGLTAKKKKEKIRGWNYSHYLIASSQWGQHVDGEGMFISTAAPLICKADLNGGSVTCRFGARRSLDRGAFCICSSPSSCLAWVGRGEKRRLPSLGYQPIPPSNRRPSTHTQSANVLVQPELKKIEKVRYPGKNPKFPPFISPHDSCLLM